MNGCSGCGGGYLLTFGLCGSCAQFTDHGVIPPPITQPGEPMPEHDPFYKEWTDRLLRRLAVQEARRASS